jgi:hypothetical protein
MRRLLARFWVAVDDEHVILPKIVFGVAFLLCGINGTFFANHQPPMTLRGQMDRWTVTAWYLLLIVGPLLSLLGKSARGRLEDAGSVIRLVGDLIVTLALLAYIAGTVQTEPVGHGGFGAYAGAALCGCAALFVLGDIRRLPPIRKLIRR